MATTQVTVVAVSPVVGYLVSVLQKDSSLLKGLIENSHAAAFCWSGLTHPIGLTVDRTFIHPIGVSPAPHMARVLYIVAIKWNCIKIDIGLSFTFHLPGGSLW